MCVIRLGYEKGRNPLSLSISGWTLASDATSTLRSSHWYLNLVGDQVGREDAGVGQL